MNKKNDEAYIALLKAKQNIAEYTRQKVKNPDWVPFYNGITERIDDIIVDYAITTKMSSDEILNCLYEVGADDRKSIFYDTYIMLKEENKDF